MDCNSLTNHELVVQTLQSPEFFRCLIEKFEVRLRVFLKRLSSLSDVELEDILQETYIKIYRNLASFDPELKLENWVYRIARNTLYDNFRSNKKHRNDVALETNEEEDRSLISFLKVEADTENQLINKEKLALLKVIIADLPQQMNEVAVLKLLEDKSYEEMGDILRKPKGTIASLVNRARKEISKRFDEEIRNA